MTRRSNKSKVQRHSQPQNNLNVELAEMLLVRLQLS